MSRSHSRQDLTMTLDHKSQAAQTPFDLTHSRLFHSVPISSTFDTAPLAPLTPAIQSETEHPELQRVPPVAVLSLDKGLEEDMGLLSTPPEEPSAREQIAITPVSSFCGIRSISGRTPTLSRTNSRPNITQSASGTDLGLYVPGM